VFGIGCTLIEPGGVRTDFRQRTQVAAMLDAYETSPSRAGSGNLKLNP